MDKEAILPKLTSIIEKKKSENGWADLALLGAPLNDLGINYKAMGFFQIEGAFSGISRKY